MRVAAIAALFLLPPAGCAETGHETGQGTVAAGSPGARHVPAKCTACHLAPAEHSLAAERWPAYLKAHRRRLHLSDEDQAFLYDFLVGGAGAH